MIERAQRPGKLVAHSDHHETAAAPKRVLLQFRVIANAARSLAPHVQPQPAVGDRKLLALSAIARAPGMGVNDVASALSVRQPTASQVVKALATLHLVQVQRDAHDRRAVRIHASADGLAVLRRLPPNFDFGDRLPEALERLDAASLSSLESGLTRLLQALPRSEQAHEAGCECASLATPK